jgi:starch synthase
LLGSDPWDPSSFSGSSVSLFNALKEEGVLARAFGLDIPRSEFILRAAPRWHPDKEVWRRRVFQSRGYRQALTRDLRRKIAAADRDTVVLAIGSYADSPAAYKGLAPVMTYQDGLGAEWWLSPYAPEAIKRDLKLREQHWSFEIGVADGAARVLTSSDYMGRAFVKYYRTAPEKVLSVGIGCNTALPNRQPQKDYARPEIVFIGKEFHRKGGDLVADAFGEVKRSFPDAVLHVIGPRSRPQELPKAEGVVFHGFLSRDDPGQAKIFYDILERAALTVLPSRYEPAGIAPLEAMSFGVPAIVTNNWALSENVQHGVTGFLLADIAPATIAATVVEALSDPERLARMSEAAYATTPERFSWQGVARRIIACAEQALAECTN